MSNLDHYIEAGFAVLGAASTILTILGSTLPAEWPATRWCARVGADLRGVHSPKAAS